ncbi:MAG: SDR family oxidoreductase [Rhizobiales bacterium]|nr:SDR family oxidoreductase [Hyphomicrobiales bacterium]OJU35606.1 MAG: 3-oxoacyl-ACP reductase [Rhizobiales bacterium 68-8]
MKFSATFHDLKGKSVFISGGGSGIGEYLTEGFLAQGAKVAFVQRSDATALCDRLERTYGTRPLFMSCDVTDIPRFQAAIDEAAAEHGPIGVLVNNAAWDNRHPVNGFTVAEWDYMLNVNLRHHFFAIQAVAPGMRAAGGGTIVNYSSISYMMGGAGFPAYAAAKAGVTGLTRALARDLGPDNIRVNALMPGWVLTDRQRELWATEEGLKAHMDRQCLKIEIQPRDMVEPTLFLASAASSVMTGQALVVDAGVVVSG